MTEKSILKVSIRQIKAARALLAWSQEEFAIAAKVSIATVKRLEANDGPLGGRPATAKRIQTALETAGIHFISDSIGSGVLLRKVRRSSGPK